MKTIMLFLSGVGFQELLLLVIFLALPLLLRPVFLWYWKINDVMVNQQKQIDLLTQLVNKLNSKKGE